MAELNNRERRLLDDLFNDFDEDKKGYINEDDACGSSRMRRLIEGLRKKTGKTKGSITKEDLVEHYANYKKKNKSLGCSDDVCMNFIKMMANRVSRYKDGDSFDSSMSSTAY